MNHSQKTEKVEIPLELQQQDYSCAIFMGYIRYLLKKYELEAVDKVFLEEVGFSVQYFFKNDHWISQSVRESFNRAIHRLAPNDAELDFEAGKLAIAKDELSAFATIASSFMNMKAFLSAVLKMQKRLNKVDHVQIIKNTNEELVLSVELQTPSQYAENLAKNWCGFLAASPIILGHNEAATNYEMISNKEFRVTARWRHSMTDSLIFRQRYYLLQIAGSLISIYLSFGFKSPILLGLGLMGLAISRYIYQRNAEFFKRNTEVEEVVEKSEKRYSALLESKVAIETLYTHSQVVGGVATEVVAAHSAEEIISLAVEALREKLGFGRAIFFKLDTTTNALVLHTSCGQQFPLEVAKKIRFDLADDTGNENHIVNIFKNRRSKFVEVNSKYLNTLSISTRHLMESMAISGFYAMSVYTGERSIGVLFVTHSTQKLLQDEAEFNTLKAVSSHIALTIDRFEKLEEETRLRKLFESYVSPDVIKDAGVGRGKSFFRTGHAVILFCDLRGFTKLVNDSAYGQGDAFSKVQRFYEIVTDATYSNAGFVNKFLGDGALAVFEFKENGPNVFHAVKNAAEQIKRMVCESEINLEVSIGVHAGIVSFATVGKEPKLEYTVLGDAVNVSARLCTISKENDNQIIFSGSFVKLGPAHHGLRYVCKREVRGVQEPVELYSVGEADKLKIAT